MNKIIFLFFSILSFQILLAQNIDPINTDRPDQSDGTYILPRNLFQVEEGIYFANDNIQNNFMLRYGLTKSTEARLLLDAGSIGGASGLLPIGLSIKQRITEQKNNFPAVTLVAYIHHEKLASKDFSSSKIPYSVKLAFQNDLTKRFNVGYNIVTSNLFETLDATISFGYTDLKKVSLFAEYFSSFQSVAIPNHNFDAGILFLINSRFQIDLAIGTELFSNENRKFFTSGISYRFKKIVVDDF